MLHELSPGKCPDCGGGLGYMVKGQLVCIQCGEVWYREKSWDDLVRIRPEDRGKDL